MSPAAPRDLTALRAAWNAPHPAHLDDEASMTARREQTRELAAAVLSAGLWDPQTMERTRMGGLYLAGAGWSRERADAAELSGRPGSPEWRNALGTPEHATLTGDGQGAAWGRWCGCGLPAPAANDEWVRYEHWTGEGRASHGFVHATCRRLLQAG
jgi:hypothetical protein